MIADISEWIRTIIIETLYPDIISSKDTVQLCIPKQKKQDFQVGIYLYDIKSDALHEKRYASLREDEWQFPDKLVIASYLIYVNEEEQFGGFSKEYEERILEAMIQLFHDTSLVKVDGQELFIQFEELALHDKIQLWQSFQLPLQPALYINVSPIAIASKRKEKASLVQHMNLESKRKE